MISIVDFGVGNLGSIRNMLNKVGAACELTSDPVHLAQASKLILPGVGAFDAGMTKLQRAGLIDVLNEAVLERKVPVLGICLGMHLMTHGSEEGSLPGLGWIAADTVRLSVPPDSGLKVPHMGWNEARPCKPSALLEGAGAHDRYYFVHSYRVRCRQPDDVLLQAEYGGTFDAAFEAGNVRGVQFHPEKSHKFGLRLLRNFAEAC